MTAAQERLLDQAKEYWDQGRQIPIDLFARLAAEGLDVEALQLQHLE